MPKYLSGQLVTDKPPAPACTHVLVHYGEIALKRKNRPFFEKTLARNIRRRLTEKLRWLYGRFLLELGPASDPGRIRTVLQRTFGVANFAFAARADLDIEDIISKALALASHAEFATFRISARRPNKRFPLSSQQVNQKAGAAVVTALGKKVNLSQPDFTIHIEITGDGAFLYSDIHQGPGGLPVGVSGRVLALISGGIDSPVAAIKAVKRGCKCIIVHFHNYTFYQEYVKQKIIKLAEVITNYNYATKLIIIPFADIQREIVRAVASDYRMIAYRRAMFRIAGRLAVHEGAKAYVTGDSIAQVASQTLDNLHVINAIADRPVLMPLIAHDKRDILALARELGTYEISILPYRDCCSAFVARHPATSTKRETVEEMEEDIDFDAIVERAVATAEVVRCPDELGKQVPTTGLEAEALEGED